MTIKHTRQKFTNNHIAVSYSVAKECYDGRILDKKEGKKEMIKAGINESSAGIILYSVFFQLMDGKEFKRTLSVTAFDYYLKMIQQDYGNARLSTALNALQKHINYIATKKDSKKKLRQVYERYAGILNNESKLLPLVEQTYNKAEQDEIADSLKSMTPAQAIEELKSKMPLEPELITINHKTYKRENKIIVLIKKARGFVCQMCGKAILKDDGTFYIEAAHITPKHQKGNESPENILILCPNHHKEFDLGKKETVSRSNDKIVFRLNEKEYNINLKISL